MGHSGGLEYCGGLEAAVGLHMAIKLNKVKLNQDKRVTVYRKI